MFGKNPVPMWACESDSLRFVTANEAAQIHYGWSLAELRRMTLPQICPKLDRRVLLLGEPVPTPLITKSKTAVEVELNCSTAFMGGQSIMFTVARPMNDLAQAQRAAHENAELLNLCHFAIVLTDVEDRVLFWNRSAERMFGWSAPEVKGRRACEIAGLPQSLSEAASQAVRRHGEWSGEIRHATKSGTQLTVHSRWKAVRRPDGALTALLMVHHDITEQKNLEEQYLRAQRLESIGTLASGIAHDLNNILTPILMSSGILRLRENDQETERLLVAIEESAERGADIVRQILTFARGVAGERMILQPRHLIGEIAKIIGQTFPKNISIKTTLPKDLWMISGDATQIHQVLLNLCVNARDAMPNGGTLAISAENVYLDRRHLAKFPGAVPGPCVAIEVADTGHGISPEIMSKIFEPFFTTKEAGKGTGLGLSTVMSIVRNHQGVVSVDSAVGKGTTFKIYLPAAPSGQGDLEQTAKRTVPRGKGQSVLVVDDEPAVRIVAVQTLENNGYQTYAAEDGSDALALFFQRHKQVDLVLTDVVMEQVNGVQLVQALRRINPAVKIIVSSGQCSEDERATLRRLGVTSFLDKPYKPDQLLLAVHDELAGTAKPAPDPKAG